MQGHKLIDEVRILPLGGYKLKKAHHLSFISINLVSHALKKAIITLKETTEVAELNMIGF